MNITKQEMRELNIHIKNSQKDSDRASFVGLGDDRNKMRGAVIVIKGNREANELYEFLSKRGWLTPGKPIAEQGTLSALEGGWR